jgi:hypothetical protein
MNTDSGFSRLLHYFSPKGWLTVAFVSMVLAGGAAMLLASPVDSPERRFIRSVYDIAERFFRDTIRLTFKERALGDSSNSIFVAPQNILDKDAQFAWVENAPDINVQHEEPALVSLAPDRLLDSDWNPIFTGLHADKK